MIVHEYRKRKPINEQKILSMLILAGIITAITGCDQFSKVDDTTQQTKENTEQIKQAGTDKTKQVVDEIKETATDIKNKATEEADKLLTKENQLKETT